MDRLHTKFGEKYCRLALLASVGMIGAVSPAQAINCDAYARTAVGQQEQNLRLKCGYRGERWHDNFGMHKSWCLFVGDRVRVAHARQRDNALRKCKLTVVPEPKKPPQDNKNASPGAATIRQPVAKGINADWCGKWARDELEKFNHYRKFGCTLSGDNSFGGLLEYCMTVPRIAISERQTTRIEEGNACLKEKSRG